MCSWGQKMTQYYTTHAPPVPFSASAGTWARGLPQSSYNARHHLVKGDIVTHKVRPAVQLGGAILFARGRHDLG